jgi:hypothetical protein
MYSLIQIHLNRKMATFGRSASSLMFAFHRRSGSPLSTTSETYSTLNPICKRQSLSNSTLIKKMSQSNRSLSNVANASASSSSSSSHSSLAATNGDNNVERRKVLLGKVVWDDLSTRSHTRSILTSAAAAASSLSDTIGHSHHWWKGCHERSPVDTLRIVSGDENQRFAHWTRKRISYHFSRSSVCS